MKRILIFIYLFLITFTLSYSQDTDYKQVNDFFSAIENNDIIKFKQLINQGIDVNKVNKDGFSPLHLAIKYNNAEMVKLLLSHKKINMNIVLPKDTIFEDLDNTKWYADGQTPLMLASYYGYDDIVLMLLNYGADILARDSIDSAMAIHIAAARGRIKALIVLLDSNAAKNTNIVNALDDTSTTPLMWAAMNNQVSSMAILIRYGADINLQDDNGWTALHFASASDSYRALELLLKNNANCNITDFEGRKPIELTNDADIEQLLIKCMQQ